MQPRSKRHGGGRIWFGADGGRQHDPHGMFTVEIADPDHPVTKGLQSFETLDELYACLTGDAPIHVVAKVKSKVDNKDYPMAFVLDYGKGRVFYTSLGHREDVWDDDTSSSFKRENPDKVSVAFQKHILGGIKWALGMESGEATPLPDSAYGR